MTSHAKKNMTRLDAETLGLQALAHIIGDPALGPRLLATTGLDASTLRTRAGDPQLLGATLTFLEQNEPDLIACAEALDLKPEQLVAARHILEAE